MEFKILENVKGINKRDNIYIPIHKNWIMLFNLVNSDNDEYEYEVVKLGWRDEFEDKGYIEDNFDILFKKPKPIQYPEPEIDEKEEMM